MNEWYKAQQMRDTYWLYVVWNPLEQDPRADSHLQPCGESLDHAKKEIVMAKMFCVPAAAINAYQG